MQRTQCSFYKERNRKWECCVLLKRMHFQPWHFPCCAKLFYTLISKFPFLLFLTCRRISVNFDCYPKMCQHFWFLKHFVFFDFLKAKNEEKLNNFVVRDKYHLPFLGRGPKIKCLNLLNFTFLFFVPWCKRKMFEKTINF